MIHVLCIVLCCACCVQGFVVCCVFAVCRVMYEGWVVCASGVMCRASSVVDIVLCVLCCMLYVARCLWCFA